MPSNPRLYRQVRCQRMLSRLACWLVCAALIALAAPWPAAAQFVDSDSVPDKHILGIIPNYGTAGASQPFEPITAKQKFDIAYHTSADWSTLVMVAGYGGLAQMENENRTFGQGVEGYAKRFAGAYADQVIGNTFSVGVIPSLLHEDPRYFPRLTGSRWSRARYALTRVFVIRTDSGRWRFNTSEILGNSIASAISNAYNPEDRNVTTSRAGWTASDWAWRSPAGLSKRTAETSSSTAR